MVPVCLEIAYFKTVTWYPVFRPVLIGSAVVLALAVAIVCGRPSTSVRATVLETAAFSFVAALAIATANHWKLLGLGRKSGLDFPVLHLLVTAVLGVVVLTGLGVACRAVRRRLQLTA
jgi:hypothetical protein